MRRRRSRGSLSGMSSDTTIGLVLLLAGGGLAYYLWKKNTPPSEPLKGLGCTGGDCGCGCGK